MKLCLLLVSVWAVLAVSSAGGYRSYHGGSSHGRGGGGHRIVGALLPVYPIRYFRYTRPAGGAQQYRYKPAEGATAASSSHVYVPPAAPRTHSTGTSGGGSGSTGGGGGSHGTRRTYYYVQQAAATKQGGDGAGDDAETADQRQEYPEATVAPDQHILVLGGSEEHQIVTQGTSSFNLYGCVEDGVFSDSKTCSYYHHCSNTIDFIRRCPDNLLFSQEIASCVFREDASEKCQQEAATTSASGASVGVPGVGVAGGDGGEDVVAKHMLVNADGSSTAVSEDGEYYSLYNCYSDGVYRDGKSCRYYHHCSNGRDYITLCPAYLHFSQAQEKCVGPADSDCSSLQVDTGAFDESFVVVTIPPPPDPDNRPDTCQEYVEQIIASELQDAFVPECEADGVRYLRRQCYNLFDPSCFCVDPDSGEEIEGTRIFESDGVGSPFDVTCGGDDGAADAFLTCAAVRDDIIASEIPDRFVPECEADGVRYLQRQCYTLFDASCFCVDADTGEEIEGTAVFESDGVGSPFDVTCEDTGEPAVIIAPLLPPPFLDGPTGEQDGIVAPLLPPPFLNGPVESKPGVCPTIAAEAIGICVDACTHDLSCDGHQKCCPNGCGHTCADPEEEQQQQQESADLTGAVHILTGDGDEEPRAVTEDGQDYALYYCGAHGLFADSSSCPYYHQCSNGVDYIRQCPAPLLFSQSSEQCVGPGDSECYTGYSHA